jgi:hypothetical protein
MPSIADSSTTLDELRKKLSGVRYESSDLIIALDFTASNPLARHSTAAGADNPYRRAMELMALEMSRYDGDDLYEVYGFGTNYPDTTDKALFSFRAGGLPCEGMAPAAPSGGGGGGGGGSGTSVLERYAAIAPRVKMGGPTTFAPIIRAACEVVRSKNFDYHVLLIVTDGEITRPEDTPVGGQSRWERETAEAIAYARNFPLSIVAVGVGVPFPPPPAAPGGRKPWELMRQCVPEPTPRRTPPPPPPPPLTRTNALPPFSRPWQLRRLAARGGAAGQFSVRGGWVSWRHRIKLARKHTRTPTRTLTRTLILRRFTWLEECEALNGTRAPGELFLVNCLNELPQQFAEGKALRGAPAGPPVPILDPPA